MNYGWRSDHHLISPDVTVFATNVADAAAELFARMTDTGGNRQATLLPVDDVVSHSSLAGKPGQRGIYRGQ
jgi:hypothetical protein